MADPLEKDSLPTDLTSVIDEIEGRIHFSGLPPVTMPVRHIFDVPGMYARQIFMPAGAILTSKIHKTKHLFIVSAGEAVVWSEEHGAQHISAPFTGITEPGTRRIIYIHQPTLWTTFHPTAKSTVEEIEEDTILTHENPHLDPQLKEAK